MEMGVWVNLFALLHCISAILLDLHTVLINTTRTLICHLRVRNEGSGICFVGICSLGRKEAAPRGRALGRGVAGAPRTRKRKS